MKALGLALFAALAVACSGATPTSPSADPGTGTLAADQNVKPGTHVPGSRDVRIIFQETDLRHGHDHIYNLPVDLTFTGGGPQLDFSVVTDRQSIASVDVPRAYTSLQVHTEWHWDAVNEVGWCGVDRTITLPYAGSENRILLHTGETSDACS